MSITVTPTDLGFVNEGDIFTRSFTVEAFIDSGGGDSGGGAPTPVPVTNCTVVPNYAESGVTINLSPMPTGTLTVTIAGKYTHIFTNKFIEYKYGIHSPVSHVTSLDDVPPHIYALTHYSPDMRRQIVVTYTVTVINMGITEIVPVTLIVLNNWTNGVAIIDELNARGEV